ncbi:hypothetical protein X768_22575 [Mesorhizobium sp. LSJC265A00]|nr:hypothetical protein X768_22575 [Mesorhizobium sp. LSJC265A00]
MGFCRRHLLYASLGFAIAGPGVAGATVLEKRQSQEIAQLKAKIAELESARAGSKAQTQARPADTTKTVQARSPSSPKGGANTAQSFFLRKSVIDFSTMLNPYSATFLGQGATISWADDYLAGTNTLQVQGYSSYLFRGDGSGALAYYGVGPFAYVSGKIAYPFKPSTERSAAQVGLDAFFAFQGIGGLDAYNLGITPYYQTDFRGGGRIYGVTAVAEPFVHSLYLGGRNIEFDAVLSPYWRIIPEVDLVRIDDAGLTNFASKTTYGLVGTTIQANAILFENNTSVPDWLCGRVGLQASYQYLWSISRADPISNFHAEVDYNLGANDEHSQSCKGGEATIRPGSKTTLALTYDDGIDKVLFSRNRKLGMTLGLQF